MDDRHVINDRAWELIEPLLPVSTGKRGGQYRDHRTVVEAIVWKYRTGAPWRDLPERTWSRDGTWDRVWRALQAAADADGRLDWVVSVDSSIARVHQHAATLPRSHTGGPAESQRSGPRAA
jgi:transposase